MRIFVAANGRVCTTNRDGSEVRLRALLEVEADRNDVYVLAPTRQTRLFSQYGLSERIGLTKIKEISSSEADSVPNVMFQYIYRLVYSLFVRYPKADLILSPSDFIVDVLPCVLAKIANPRADFVVWSFLLPNTNPDEGSFYDKFRNFLFRCSHGVSLGLAKLCNAKILVLNRDDEKALRARGFDRVKTVTMGIDDPSFADVHRENLPERYHSDYIFVGRLHRQKGLDALKSFLEAISRRSSESRVIVIGGGDQAQIDRFNSYIAQDLGSPANIEYLGFVDGEEKIKYLVGSKIFLMPSTQESFGTTIIEAMAARLVVVAFDLPVYRSLFSGRLQLSPVGDDHHFIDAAFAALDVSDTRTIDENRSFARRFDWAEVFTHELE